MGVVTIILSIIVLGISLFLLFKILKWAFRKKVRVIWMFTLLVSVVVGITIHRMFFIKMEFIQSQVYPNLYFVKNPDENTNVLNKAVKEMVIQITKDRANPIKEASDDMQTSTLRFYEYCKGDWGESGTAYFVEHKERRDGMTAELLEYYPEYLIAEYSLQPCNEGKENLGKLNHYNNRKLIKTDTLLNSCK